MHPISLEYSYENRARLGIFYKINSMISIFIEMVNGPNYSHSVTKAAQKLIWNHFNDHE